MERYQIHQTNQRAMVSYFTSVPFLLAITGLVAATNAMEQRNPSPEKKNLGKAQEQKQRRKLRQKTWFERTDTESAMKPSITPSPTKYYPTTYYPTTCYPTTYYPTTLPSTRDRTSSPSSPPSTSAPIPGPTVSVNFLIALISMGLILVHPLHITFELSFFLQ